MHQGGLPPSGISGDEGNFTPPRQRPSQEVEQTRDLSLPIYKRGRVSGEDAGSIGAIVSV
jgi:hypothetical protein